MCVLAKDEINSSSTFTGRQGSTRAPTQYNPHLELTETSHLTEARRLLRGKKRHYE